MNDAFAWEVLVGVTSNVVWAAITSLLAAAYVLRKDRSKFSGRWRARIRWTSTWAEEMLLGAPSDDPHSRGEVVLSYGSGAKRKQYWGLSYWTLKDGTKARAELCVELGSIHVSRTWTRRLPLFKHQLGTAHLTSVIRRPLPDFNYPKEFANYQIVFTSSTEDALEGRVQATLPDDPAPIDVGSFTARRLT